MRFRSLFSRAKVEQDLDEELRYHLERQIEEDVAAGMSRADARRAALRAFQGLEQRKEECRDMRGWNLIDNLMQDLRFTMRQLRKNPGFTSTAILMLALGMCASVAIFAFVDAALFKPLPYREPSTLLGVYEHIPQCPRCNLSYLDYLDWKRLNKVFTSLDVYHNNGYILTTPSGVEPAPAAQVSAGFFRTLGVAPALGRDFYAGEDRPGAPHTVMLSNATWQKRYGGKPDVVGQTVTLDNDPYVIIGVLPADFHFAPAGTAEFWTRRGRYRVMREEAQLPQSLRRGPAEGWRLDPDGASGHDFNCESAGEAVSRFQPRPGRGGATAFGSDCRRHPSDTADAAERRRIAAADRLRECGESAAGPRRKPPARDVGSQRAGSFDGCD